MEFKINMSLDYQIQPLTYNLYKIFAGVYADFRAKAVSEYKFELEPLSFDEFIEAIEKGLVKCLVLLEDYIPTAFLAYTTAISEAVELNLIHCLGDENLVEKRKALLEKFLEITEEDRADKIVCYPMLGTQGDFITDITNYGFKPIGLAVLRFLMSDATSKKVLENVKLTEKDFHYNIVPWDDAFKETAVQIVQSAFENTSDALFDPRFKSIEGTSDIIDKIVNNIYADFLLEATMVLLYDGSPCGFCFMNITGGSIVNIPIFCITEEHQGKGLSKHLLKNALDKIVDMAYKQGIMEVNTTTETDNNKALKMYRSVGFIEDYNYPQVYLPIK